MLDLAETFEKFNEDHLKFDRVQDRPSGRPDLCAFLLLDKLVPGGTRDLVAAAEHDIIYLDADCSRLAEVATEDDILTLTRCGVHYDSSYDCLALFV